MVIHNNMRIQCNDEGFSIHHNMSSLNLKCTIMNTYILFSRWVNNLIPTQEDDVKMVGILKSQE